MRVAQGSAPAASGIALAVLGVLAFGLPAAAMDDGTARDPSPLEWAGGDEPAGEATAPAAPEAPQPPAPSPPAPTADTPPSAEPPPAGAPATPAAPAPGKRPRDAWSVFPVRPIALPSLGAATGFGPAFGLDLGIRIGALTARWAFRGADDERGEVTYLGGRLGWVFAEKSWFAAYGALGGGRLRYSHSDSSVVSMARAFSAEVGVMLGSRSFLGPCLGVGLEVLAQLSDASPRDPGFSAPGAILTVSVNPVAARLY